MKINATMLKMNNAFFIITFSICVLCSSYLYSRPTGISGYTLKTNSSGCAGCHGSASSQVSVVINGPATLKTGETGNYTVTITGGSGTGVGTDIAASNGTLANSDANLKILNGELTQPSAKTFSGGKYVFSFQYTAPSQAGTQTLYACGVSTKPQWNFAPNFSVNVQSATSGVKENGQIVAAYSLNQNYPNPFNPATVISYSLPKQSSVKLVVFNSIGQEVKTLFSGIQAAGNHSVNFNAAELSSGIYFYSIEAKSETGNETFKSVRKMAFLK
ncbi:MAG: choice-of-anchor V domain-containing protein [Bacteroidota bacterium]